MSKQKRCRCLDCNGIGEVAKYQYHNELRNPIVHKQTCQSCLGDGWLYEKHFLEQVKHHPNMSNLEIIDAYENGPNKEIPMLPV